MLAKYLVAGVAGSLLLASSAFAAEDTATKTPAPATAAATNNSFHGDWRTSKVVGLNVYNEQNENVGSINDLLMDKSGNVKAAVISVGGFLGMGSRLIAVPLDKVKFSDQPVSSTTSSNTAPPAGNRPATTTGSASNQPATTTTTAKANPWYPDHAMINGSKDELKNLPEFKFD
jgi:sporulation protein YlmC with PRC-barrel domain